jgi:hypothetical protein
MRASSGCHPEEPQATKDLCSSLNLELPRFFASLRMTVFKGFFATYSGQHLPT